MPTGERVRYTLSAVIPRNDWREPLTQLRAQRDAGVSYQEKGDDLRKVSSIELVLAKIVPFRYIAFKFFIRYFDGRIVLACENLSKPRHAVCLRSCVRGSGASRGYSSAFTQAG